MRIPTVRSLIALYSTFVYVSIAAPNPQDITDPATIVSTEKAGAGPLAFSDLFAFRLTTGGTWSPDGKEVAFSTSLSGRLNLWKVSASGGSPVQLHKSDSAERAAIWSPDGKTVLYLSDRDGTEMFDIFAAPIDGGEAVNLTHTDAISEISPRWSPDRKALAILYRKKTSPMTDVAIIDWNTREVRNLTKEEEPDRRWSEQIWSPDGRFIYATRATAAFTDASVYRIDIATGQKEELTPHNRQTRIIASAASPDGHRLLVTADSADGYLNVALLELATKKLTWVTALKTDAESGKFSPDGKEFTYQVDADGRLDLFLAQTATLKSLKLNISPGRNAFADYENAFSPDGTRILFIHQSSTEPMDLWMYNTKTRDATPITTSAVGGLKTAMLPASTLVHYKSFDGTRISALVWLPYNLRRDGSAPAVVIAHGGPASQTIDSYSPLIAALTSRGYVCIAPNVRGSSGYGRDFEKANFKDLGGGDLEDEEYAAKFLIATGYISGKKIAITGESYGGFLTLMAIGKKPDFWAAAVERSGIVNWKSIVERSDPALQEYAKSLLGDPVADRQAYEKASPALYLRNARAPLLVLQGENDVRVPKSEAEAIVALYRETGSPIESHIYPGEGHTFGKRPDQLDAVRRTVEWLDKYVGNPM